MEHDETSRFASFPLALENKDIFLSVKGQEILKLYHKVRENFFGGWKVEECARNTGKIKKFLEGKKSVKPGFLRLGCNYHK